MHLSFFFSSPLGLCLPLFEEELRIIAVGKLLELYEEVS